jgi:FixJ family two-component response regulator
METLCQKGSAEYSLHAFLVRAESMAQEPTVFVVDDDPSLRTAVSRLIGSVGLPVRTFGSADEFLDHVDPSLPGCVVLDVRMPGASGLELQDRLVANGYSLPVIFVSAHADVALTVRAMRAGALQVFTKPFDDQALLDAIHEALLIDRQRRLDEIEVRELQERFSTLTVREREVMRLVVTGMLNKEIASALGTTEKTVKAHRGQVVHKMRAHSVPDLVRMADRLDRHTAVVRPRSNTT